MTEVLTAPVEEEVLSYQKTRNSGILVATKDHKVDSLHVICERAGGGFDYFRCNRNDKMWTGPLPSPGSKSNIHAPVLYTGDKYQLDALYRETTDNRETVERPAGTLYHTNSTTYHDTSVFNLWTGPRYELPDGTGISGPPAVCRWHDDWQPGADIVAPLAEGGFRYWYRNNAATFYTGQKKVFTEQFGALAMVKGSGSWLVLYAVETNGTLWGIQRNADGKWNTKNLGGGFTGQPALVESARGENAQYDLVVPHAAGQLFHFAVSSGFSLQEVNRLGVPGRVYRDVGLVYNASPQRLEVVARPADGGLPEHWVNTFDGKVWAPGVPFPPLNTTGSWEVRHDLKAIGIHTTLLRSGDVVTYGMSDDSEHHAVGSRLAPRSGTVTPLAQPMPHVFCSGQAQLPNGDLLVAGGHNGHEKALHKYTFAGFQWNWAKLPSLEKGRWYPTVTTLPDGNVMLLGGATTAGGSVMNNSYEIFDPKNENGPRKLIDLWDEIGEKFCDDYDHIDMYPFVFVLPNKRVFVHSRYTTRFFNYPQRGRGSWGSRIDGILKSPRTYGYQGTAVLLPLKSNELNEYPSPTVAIFGGSSAKNAGIDTPATDTVETMVVEGTSPSWQTTGKLGTPRVMPDAVLLPDGKVLIVNGSRAGRGDGSNSRQPVQNVEIYDPANGTFTEVAPTRVPRLYHSSAVLLPDATVLVTGKCKVYNAWPYKYPEHRGEVYTPAYLKTGKPRPIIADAPLTIDKPEEMFPVKLSDFPTVNIKSVMLIRLGAATHSFNMDQRAVSLPFTAAGNNLTVKAPKTNWVVPPGYYMLFVVSDDGVPSEARFLRVETFPVETF